MNNWISVLERMPKQDVLVLVFSKKTYGSVVVMKPNYERLSDSWLSCYWCDSHGGAMAHIFDESGKPTDKDISYWMPLPGPPNDSKHQELVGTSRN